jgi:hypothetical protein
MSGQAIETTRVTGTYLQPIRPHKVVASETAYPFGLWNCETIPTAVPPDVERGPDRLKTCPDGARSSFGMRKTS